MKIIGIDLGGTNIGAGLVEGNKVVKIITQNTNASAGAQAVINQLKNIIGSLGLNGVKAIGIGVPSIVDTQKGIVYEVTNIPSWKKVKLADELKKTFNLPILINNDANCFALGEKHFGRAKKFKNIVGLTIGTGLGAGIIIDGKIYNGLNCGAGEICNIPYLDQNLEYYCSGNFFLRFGKKSGHSIYQAALSGDKRALKLFADFGEHVGVALAISALAYDPEIIVIGGSVTEAFPLFEASMRQSLQAKVYKKTYANLKIARSSNKNIAVLGAASLYLNRLAD